MTQRHYVSLIAWFAAWLASGATWAQTASAASSLTANLPTATAADPYQSYAWADMHKQFLGGEPVVFDPRVQVTGPAFAEDPMNVPISVNAGGLPEVTQIVVLVDRNPIRKVLVYHPQTVLPQVSFRFKLEQASPVRAAAKTKDGVWHVGSTWVESSGGGCTVAGATRQDGSWSKNLGGVSARIFDAAPVTPAQSVDPSLGARRAAARLRLRVMHPMDTGLVGGIPAFYLNRLQVSDQQGTPLLRLELFEPVSENPVFSFDFPQRVPGSLVLTGTDNNGNRVSAQIE